jgi:L-fucose isomerase
VNILVCAPDTWAFPQLTSISLLQQFPAETPMNITCGNSGPKPGVVYAHALSGAISQYGRLVTLNVGNWDDKGMNPQMSKETAKNLIDWCYAAVTYMLSKAVELFVRPRYDGYGNSYLAHYSDKKYFRIEITRLDMKLLADMLRKALTTKKSVSTSQLDRQTPWQ